MRSILSILLLASAGVQCRGQTVVGIRGAQFTINGQPTYTAASGFPSANHNLAGTLLNVRAVQAVFDDANYPGKGSRANPYHSVTQGEIFWDYPDGPWDPERNVREFLDALPSWRRCGLLAFTVNLQGGGPPDGNYGEKVTLQPHNNSGFDPQGNLKPAYADRLRRVIAEADRLGMVAIVGFFYFGSNERIQVAPDDRYVREAIRQGCRFLKGLPYRNVLIEINNETNPRTYKHRILQPEGALDAVALAQQAVERQIPVSMSWSGGIMPRGSRGDAALRAVDYIMFHTNGQTPEEVHQTIQAMRRWVGYDRPLIINEDGVSTFNLRAAVEERVGWGFYDNGLDNYRDGFQAPPTVWRINTPVKWLFFEQVARLTGSPVPPRPDYAADDTPVIEVFGLEAGQVLKEPAWIEAIVRDRHPRWPIKRVEFFIDGSPYSYRRNAPFLLNGQEWWDMVDVPAGKHVLRVVAYDMRGPRFAEVASMVEIPFAIEK
ncbi:MAG TPA: hypothetical protein VE959_10720 [Bryobacteraceae bacterium]|nr:hypothetical protein [Bryobacteraceae bacterium]